MPRLSPCPSCESHVFVDARTCPHCGASLRQTVGKSAGVVLVGLALTGCPTIEPVYGVPESGTDTATDEASDTGTGMDSESGTDDVDSSGEAEYGVPDTGVDTDTGTDIDSTGEAEYGVPDTGSDSGTDTGTDTGGEPLYGLGDSGN